MKVLHRRIPVILLVSALALLAVPAHAGLLWDWSAYIDGTTYNPPPLPGSVNTSAFDFATGLGKITFTVTGVGDHTVGIWLDPYIDEGFANQFNEYGLIGVIPAGLAWQLDEPGALWLNFKTKSLDNTNHVPVWSTPPTACCDVAMALLRSFTLTAGQTATFNIIGTEGLTPAGILSLIDAEAGRAYNLESSFSINGGPGIPEPGFLPVLSFALGWMLLRRR